MRPAPELGQEIDAFQSQLLALPEFKTLRAMEQMCRLYAQPTNEPTEFNLYAETAHFHIWLRLITRERDYNLYTYFSQNNPVVQTQKAGGRIAVSGFFFVYRHIFSGTIRFLLLLCVLHPYKRSIGGT